MVSSTKGLGLEKDCAGKGQQHIQKTDPSSRQRGRPTKQDRNCQTNKYLVMSPIWGSTPRLTGWLTVSRNVTLTLTLTAIGGDWEEMATVSQLSFETPTCQNTCFGAEELNWGIEASELLSIVQWSCKSACEETTQHVIWRLYKSVVRIRVVNEKT
jgi:hypothetical protein